MRLIDADKLIEDLEHDIAIDEEIILYVGTDSLERQNAQFGKDCRENMVDILNRVPTANQWIPCSERLPEEEGWYLVTIQNDKTRKRRTENDLFAIGIAEAHKHTPYKFCKDGHRQTVIAWMPLPEPYEAS